MVQYITFKFKDDKAKISLIILLNLLNVINTRPMATMDSITFAITGRIHR